MNKQKPYTPLIGQTHLQFITEKHPPVKRYIVAAACKDPDSDLMFVGSRHWSPAMRKQCSAIFNEDDKLPARFEQGFIDQYDQYLTREQACVIVKMNNQPLRDVPGGTILFSEHLY